MTVVGYVFLGIQVSYFFTPIHAGAIWSCFKSVFWPIRTQKVRPVFRFWCLLRVTVLLFLSIGFRFSRKILRFFGCGMRYGFRFLFRNFDLSRLCAPTSRVPVQHPRLYAAKNSVAGEKWLSLEAAINWRV